MYNVIQQVIKLSDVIKKMRSYCFFQRFIGILAIGFVLTGMVVSAQGATMIADQSQFDEDEIRKWLKGQLDVLDTDFIIINDTSYLLTNATDFYGGRDDLEIGGVVCFKPSDDNKYIEGIYLDEAAVAVEQSSVGSGDDHEKTYNSASPGEMKLENGVWVN